MKDNKFTIALSAVALTCSCLSFVNTLPKNETVENGKSAYEIAVDNGFVGTEKDWLASLVGKDGQDGKDGKDAVTAYKQAVNNGYDGTEEDFAYEIFGVHDETFVKMASQLSPSAFYSFVDANAESIYEIKLSKAQNTSKLNELYNAFYSVFNIEKSLVNVTTTTPNTNPSWNHTTSIFSGWGGSIGEPTDFDTIKFKVKARDKAITQIKVFLTENDKNGEVIYEEVLDVNIEPYQEGEVYWVLPEKFENIENKSLYFIYNCNQLCDRYAGHSGNAATIPVDKYQAIFTYYTNGKLLSKPSSMTNVSGNPCSYIYVELGNIEYNLILDEDSNNLDYVQAYEDKLNVILPEQYDLVVGDTFQLFYRGVIQAVDPYNYYIKTTCKKGSAYPRYYEWTPTVDDIGTYDLKIEVMDNNGNYLGSDTVKLVVKEAVSPNENINVLCFGDSLTAGGYWVKESYRRLTQSGGTSAGSELTNITYVGSKKTTVDGIEIGYEGTGGWTWGTYLGTTSPFYDPELGEVNFTTYCERNGIEDIDVVNILLTWNGMPSAFKTNWTLNDTHFVNAKILIDKIHEAYPNAIINCMGIQMPSQNGGAGYNYGASSQYSDAYGILVTAMHYNKTLEQFCNQEQYKDFVNYVDTAGQFDTDYNMPSTNKQVNTRNPQKESFGTNGVHPSQMGYYQIADAVYRAMIGNIHEYYQEME